MWLAELRDWIDKDDGEPLEPIEPIVPLNAIVYSFAALQFGALWWKAAIVGFIIFTVSSFHYGHRALARLGVLLLVVAIAVWCGILPPPGEWLSLLAPLLARYS